MKNPERGNAFVGLLVIVGLIWLFSSLFGGGNDSSSEDTYHPTTYSGSSYNRYGDDYEEYDDYSYENPYDDGSGHSAGYEWAEENDVDSCGGNSDSFIEGCEEYVNQRDEQENYEDEYDYGDYDRDY